MQYTIRTYASECSATYYQTVFVPWSEYDRIVGTPDDIGTPENIDKLRKALIDDDAPKWIEWVKAEALERGVKFYGPTELDI